MNTYQIHFKLVYLFFFFGKQALGQTCYTSDKQQGHCVPLNECPKAFPTFANPPKGSEKHLHRFLCKDDQQLKVCCGTTANFTLLENYVTSDYADISKEIVRSEAFTDTFDSNSLSHTDLLISLDAFTDTFDASSLSHIDLPLILAESVDSEVKPKKCLGILANSRYVITPAQCVGQEFRLVGVQFRGKNNSSITFGVEEIISHPFFDPVSGVNDVALLRLNQTVSSDDVAALSREPLYEDDEPVLIFTNLDLFTIERGLNKTTVSTASLSKEDCEEKFLQKGAYAVVTEYDLCIKNLENATKFTCNEFTGVPLFMDDKVFGAGFIGFSSSRTVCDDDLPDIYTNVNAYEDWLINQMRPWPTNNDSCTTPNGEIGECWNVYHCPALLDASSDVTNEAEAASLRGYICEEGLDKLSVCCVTPSNSTVTYRKDEAKPIEVPTKFLETRLCGLQHKDDYFTSSTALAIDEFPWIAGIEVHRNFLICTGTLINSRYVLASGACQNVDFDPNNTIVPLGDYNWLNNTSCVKDPDVDATDCTETEIYGIEDIMRHPFYVPYFGLNSISLLRLNKTVSYYTDFVRPICLPIPGTSTAKVGDTMYMSSWGLALDDSRRGIKKKVLTQLIEKEECQRLRRKEIVSNTFCTLDYENNTEISIGRDSGGALMVHDNYRWHIEGIMFLDRDDPSLPVVYVNVSSYINWILANMNPW